MKTIVVNIKTDKYDINIGRTPGKKNHYGNPFIIGKDGNRNDVCNKHIYWLLGYRKYKNIEPERRQWILEHLEELRGKVLGCFCKPLKCHGDNYVKILKPNYKYLRINN